jgi:cytidine deaminase
MTTRRVWILPLLQTIVWGASAGISYYCLVRYHRAKGASRSKNTVWDKSSLSEILQQVRARGVDTLRCVQDRWEQLYQHSQFRLQCTTWLRLLRVRVLSWRNVPVWFFLGPLPMTILAAGCASNNTHCCTVNASSVLWWGGVLWGLLGWAEYDSSDHGNDDDDDNDNNNDRFQYTSTTGKRRVRRGRPKSAEEETQWKRAVPQEPQPSRMQRLWTQPNTVIHSSSASSLGSTSAHTHTHTTPRYLEILVHNVSHTDLVLSLSADTETMEARNSRNSHIKDASTEMNSDEYCVGRPRFSCFDKYTQLVLDTLDTSSSATASLTRENIVSFPRYERSIEDPRFSIKQEPTNGTLPTGFALPTDPHLTVDLDEVRIRGIDQCKVTHTDGGPGSCSNAPRHQIRHVFFPLLATLLPRWRERIAETRQSPPSQPHQSSMNNDKDIKRVLILVTGVGTPRNWTHSVNGNSTQVCATLMKRFLRVIDPDLVVVTIHSDTNIFRYDENLLFVERDLMPVLNSYRDAHAQGQPYPDETPELVTKAGVETDLSFNVDWRKTMAVKLSFADGTPARTYAIQASLRSFRPTYFHFWQLKTFWHESKIVDDDIEEYSFEAMETSPAVDTTKVTDPYRHLVIDEMKAFQAEMIKTLQGQNDIHRFWLRKTHKPVLAVLLVEQEGQPILYRGTNMEVSMPTGSLCAERNVIGTALAANPSLRRQDLKMIAVLAVPWQEKLTEIGSAGTLRSFEEPFPASASSSASLTSLVGTTTLENGEGRKTSIGSDHEEWILSSSPAGGEDGSTGATMSKTRLPPAKSELGNSFDLVDSGVPSSSSGVASTAPDRRPNDDMPSTPVRRIALFSRSGIVARKSQRTVVLVQSTRDLNPLPPCGACNEWLKKIAECNPYFCVLTFTDAECHGVYCTPCQE